MNQDLDIRRDAALTFGWLAALLLTGIIANGLAIVSAVAGFPLFD